MGCKLAQQILPDLIVLDWKINALDSIRTLRQQVATRLIPILIIIEKSIEHNQFLAQTLELGGIDCITSPLQCATVRAKVSAALNFAEVYQKDKELMKQHLDAKNRELSAIALLVEQKNKALATIEQQLKPLSNKNQSLQSTLKLIQDNLGWDNYWNQFKKHFEEVHPHFFNTLNQTFPHLSTHEVKLCAYIKMSLSTKEILQVLNISVRGLETARYRLRKKMHLGQKTRLDKYIQSL
jgi:CheY-like chemotaxis protein